MDAFILVGLPSAERRSLYRSFRTVLEGGLRHLVSLSLQRFISPVRVSSWRSGTDVRPDLQQPLAFSASFQL
jgi:hypothetical protein